MPSRNIIFVEAPLGEISPDTVEKLVADEMAKFEEEHWDGYQIGGRWDNSLNGKNVLPVDEIRQAHLNSAEDIIAGGAWFSRTTYRPWLPIGNGKGKMFERKPASDMPSARWMRKMLVTCIKYEYQYLAVAIDVHN